jgi:hypothetical protein
LTIGLTELIAVTILRRIDYLARFGRIGETIQRVEEATWAAMKTQLKPPNLRGRPMASGAPPARNDLKFGRPAASPFGTLSSRHR